MVQHVTRNVTPKDCEPPQSDDNPLDHSLTAKDFTLSQLRSKNYQHNFYTDCEFWLFDMFIANEKNSSQAFGNFVFRPAAEAYMDIIKSDSKNSCKRFSVVSFWVSSEEKGR